MYQGKICKYSPYLSTNLLVQKHSTTSYNVNALDEYLLFTVGTRFKSHRLSNSHIHSLYLHEIKKKRFCSVLTCSHYLMDQLAVDKGLLKKLKACLDFRKAIDSKVILATLRFSLVYVQEEMKMKCVVIKVIF